MSASPAPGIVKNKAKRKLLGESVLINEIMPAGNTKMEQDANRKKVVRGGINVAKRVAKGVAGIAKREGTLSQKVTGAAIDAVKGGVRKLEKFANEEKIIEMRFDDGKEGTAKRLKALAKKRKLPMSKMKNHPQFKDDVKEGSAYGIYKGDGKVKIGQAPRKQKGAMAYDGPNKERSEAADRVLAKTAAKRAKMKEEFVDEMAAPVKKPPKEKKMSLSVLDNIRKTNTGAGSQYEQVVHEKMDPVGQEDGDINNDGKKDGTDKYLASRRKAIGKAIAKKRGKVKEGFSAWRIDLDFNESVKK